MAFSNTLHIIEWKLNLVLVSRIPFVIAEIFKWRVESGRYGHQWCMLSNGGLMLGNIWKGSVDHVVSRESLSKHCVRTWLKYMCVWVVPPSNA
ncbi:hypothetical protein NPIL_476081 [Nephila pilipes]|uniref:Uncharacterized protein n=1 Tax=Nephila pilipes TaxID=299642 RepID=A0A8X6N7K5_NEPPI|nr:hypothetical protein NPIL_476081 [Nephila pilipes]